VSANDFVLALPKENKKLDALILSSGDIEAFKQPDTGPNLTTAVFRQQTLNKLAWYAFLNRLVLVKYKCCRRSDAKSDEAEHVLKFNGQPCADDYVIETEDEENFFKAASVNSSGSNQSGSSTSSSASGCFASSTSPSMSGTSKTSLTDTYIDSSSSMDARENKKLLNK
jgi:hypothetical protein